MSRRFFVCILFFVPLFSFCQEDSADVEAVRRTVNLSEVVVRSGLNVSRFLSYVKNDTTFYKSFRNLRVLGFSAINDIRMLDKNGGLKASLHSTTKQTVSGGCRSMTVEQQTVTGDMLEGDAYNYYTAQLYASLFFTNAKVCGENNIVKGTEISTQNKSGLQKHKEQLKMMFFNPGKKIPGIPFIGDKLDIFDERLAQLYDYGIDVVTYNGQECYIFTIKRKENLTASQRNDIVFDNITTWFNTKTMEITGRTYDLSYDTGLYDFDVHMEVLMTKFGDYLVPQTIRYKGDWDIAFKKRERGVFTATLFNFTR